MEHLFHSPQRERHIECVMPRPPAGLAARWGLHGALATVALASAATIAPPVEAAELAAGLPSPPAKIATDDPRLEGLRLPRGTSLEMFNLSLPANGCFVGATQYLRAQLRDPVRSKNILFADYITFEVDGPHGKYKHTDGLVGLKTGEVFLGDIESGELPVPMTAQQVLSAPAGKIEQVVRKVQAQAQEKLARDTAAGITKGRICPPRDLSNIKAERECAQLAQDILSQDENSRPTTVCLPDGTHAVLFFGVQNKLALFRPEHGTTAISYEPGAPFPGILQQLATQAHIHLADLTIVSGYLANR